MHDKVNILMVDDQPQKAAHLRSYAQRAWQQFDQCPFGTGSPRYLLKVDVAVILIQVQIENAVSNADAIEQAAARA